MSIDERRTTNDVRITKAMILAAGLGTRLRPLTDTTPKPMIEVHGKPLIAHALERVAAAGITDVMINLHHLPEQIRGYVGEGSQWNIRANFSFEPELLGTGGGIKKVEDWFHGESFILYNADILCDFDIAKLTAGNTSTPCLVVRQIDPGETYTPVDLANNGHIQGFGKGSHHYCGIMRCTPSIVATLPQGPSCLVQQGIIPLLNTQKAVATQQHCGYWNDIGTLDRLEAAETR